MPRTLAETLSPLEIPVRQHAYMRAWNQLTIVGRVIGFDPGYSEAVQLSCLKSLNEIQHRVWRAFYDPEGYAPEDLVSEVRAHIREAPQLRGHVGSAFKRAIEQAEEWDKSSPR